MSKARVIKNYIYNVLYDIFVIITPLITAPYVSRVLGSSGLGKYSFTASLSSYFVLVASLGFGLYAKREMARIQGNKREQSKLLWEIIVARSVCVLCVTIVYLTVILFGTFKEYTPLMYLYVINILAAGLDITFFFHGNEQFGTVVIRNVIIKIIGVISIFVFVKTEKDVGIYILCNCVILLLSNMSLWITLPGKIVKVAFSELEIKRHYIPTIRLFLPTLATSLYTMLDKTLIGIVVPNENIIVSTKNGTIIAKLSDVENGYYEQADKIVRMALTIVTSLGTVMIARNSNEAARGHEIAVVKNVYKAQSFTFHIAIPMSFGLAAIANNLCPWFFGPGYEKVPLLIMILSPLFLVIGLSNVIGIQYLLPMKQDKKYTKAICFGAGFNLLLNIPLIHFMYSYGAAIATVSAEMMVTIMMYRMVGNKISFPITVKENWKCIVSGSIMFANLFFFDKVLTSSIVNTLIMLVGGVLIYSLCLIVIKDPFVNEFKDMVLLKFHRGKGATNE